MKVFVRVGFISVVKRLLLLLGEGWMVGLEEELGDQCVRVCHSSGGMVVAGVRVVAWETSVQTEGLFCRNNHQDLQMN